MKVYVASSLSNKSKVEQLYAELEKDGWKVTYKWTEHGSVQAEGPEKIAEVALKEIAGVMNADLLIVLLPGGRGTHVELGVASALRLPTLICGETMENGYESCFYYGPGVLQRIPALTDGYSQRVPPWDFTHICREALRWWHHYEKTTSRWRCDRCDFTTSTIFGYEEHMKTAHTRPPAIIPTGVSA